MKHTFYYLENTKVVLPYTYLAPIYDSIMQHVDYCGWAKYITNIFTHWGIKATSVCDISCGTGTLTMTLASMGYNVVGFDFSEPMIKVAKEKSERSFHSITFAQGDMKSVVLAHPVHIMISLYDSVNYLFKDKEFIQMCHAVHNALLPDGLFIFDICTEYNAQKHFLDYYDSGTIKGIKYKRHSYYETDKKIQNTEFAVQYPKDSTWYIEHHRQKIFSPGKIRECIPPSLFKCLGSYGDYTLEKESPHSERIHFVLQKRRLIA